jgi:hypothetical protein
MLSRTELAQWGHDAGEYKATAETLAEWVEQYASPVDLSSREAFVAWRDEQRRVEGEAVAWLEGEG